MFHMVPGGTAARLESAGMNTTTAAQVQAIMDQMKQLMEGLLERMQTLKENR